MNKLRLLCVVLAITAACAASAQSHYTYDSYDSSDNYSKPEGFRLDVNAGVSMLLFKFEHPRIKLDKAGPQFNISPSYVFSTENQAIALDFIWKQHSYEHSLMMDNVDIDIFYIGPKYTWEATPYKKGSVFLDGAIYYGRVKEEGRKQSVDNNFETWGISGSVGYSFRLARLSKMFVKATWMYSYYQVDGGIYAGRNLSSLSLTTGFWLFK